jgi:hypothetical protein
MATDTLQVESARATPAFDARLRADAARMMGLSPDDPRVTERLTNEANECAAMEYAAGAVRAAMDVLAVLECLEMAQMFERPHEMNMQQRETADQLLRLARRNLRDAVGGNGQPGYDRFLDMLAAHGLSIYDD